MVEYIKGLEAELQVLSFGEVKILERGKIPIGDTGPDDGVAAHIAKRSIRLLYIGGGVKPLVRGSLTAGQLRGYAGSVRTVKEAPGQRNIAVLHGQRESALDGNDGTELPAAQQRVDQPSLIEKRLAFAKGKLVQQGGDEAMVHIKDGEGAFTRKTVAVLRKQRIRSQGADTAAAVDGFGPGVPDQVSESAREAP